MIKTQLDPQDVPGILNLGRQLHQESQFNQTPFDEAKCRMLLHGTTQLPEKLFMAYDDALTGLLILQMSSQFFNDSLWAGDQAFYVSPAARGNGLAHDLLEAGATWAAAHGATDLVIMHHSGIGMDKASSFYCDKEGFILSGLMFTKSLIVTN